MLNPNVSSAVMRSPAAWKLSNVYVPRLRFAPPRKRLRRGAARPLRVSREEVISLVSFGSASLRLIFNFDSALRQPESASRPLRGGCARFAPRLLLLRERLRRGASRPLRASCGTFQLALFSSPVRFALLRKCQRSFDGVLRMP
jgi:hypothetical protein